MRRVLTFFLLASAAAAPLSAQTANPQDQRPQRDERGDRGNRPDRGPRGEQQQQQQQQPRGDRRDGGDPRIAQRDARGQGDQRFDDRGQGARGPDGRGQDGRFQDRRGPNGRGPDGRGYDGRGADGRGPDGRDWRDGDRGNRPGYAGNYDPRRDDRGGWNDRNPRGNGGWNSQWRGDRRYDWQGYRAGNRALYRAPRYYGPRGYEYSRWSRGFRVQPYFYGRNYWISDPYRYRLPPAYGDYRWVRYYDDVALIDIRTGLIEDIIYSFFYR